MDKEILDWYAANGFDLGEMNKAGIFVADNSIDLQSDAVKSSAKRFANSGGTLDEFNNVDFTLRPDAISTLNSKKNAVNFINSSKGRFLIDNISKLRDQYEVSKIVANSDKKSLDANLKKFISDRYGAEFEREGYDENDEATKSSFIRNKYNQVRSWADTFGSRLYNSGMYIIAPNYEGELFTGFEYIPANDKWNNEAPKTTGELLQMISANESNNGNKISSLDLGNALQMYMYGKRGNYPSHSSGTGVLDIVAPRTRPMLFDDEFESKYGGKVAALLGDVVEAGVGLVPIVGEAEKLARGVKVGRDVYRALDKIEKLNPAGRTASKFLKGAAENTAALGAMNAVGNAYDTVVGTNRGAYLDTPASFLIAAGLGGFGKQFSRSGKSIKEIKQDIWKHMTRNNPEGTGVDFKKQFNWNSPDDIDDLTVKAWMGDIGGTELFNKSLIPFNDETIHYNQEFAPPVRLNEIEAVVNDPFATQLANETANRVNARNASNYEQRLNNTILSNDEAVARAEHEARMDNGRRQFIAEMEAEGAYNDLVAEARDEFEKAIRNNEYWADRFEKSNADYQRVFWDWIKTRRDYKDVIDNYNHLKQIRQEQNAPYVELGLPPRKPNQVARPKSNESFDEVSKAGGTTFDETIDWDEESLQMLLDHGTLNPNAKKRVEELLARKRAMQLRPEGTSDVTTPNLAEGETRQAIEDQVLIPTIPQSISDNQAIATGAYNASQGRLNQAARDLADAEATPIGEVSVPQVRASANVRPLPERPKDVSFAVAGNEPSYADSPTAKRTIKIKTQSYDESPMTDKEWFDYTEAKHSLFGNKSGAEMRNRADAGAIREVVSEAYKRGATPDEAITDAEWKAFTRDHWREVGGDRFVNGEYRKGKYHSAEDMENDPQARLMFDNFYTHVIKSNRIAPTKPVSKSPLNETLFNPNYRTTSKESRIHASSYDQNASKNLGGAGKDKATADMIRLMGEIDDPSKREAFQKAVAESRRRRTFMGNLPNSAALENPEYNWAIPKASDLTSWRKVLRTAPDIVGRELATPYHVWENIPTELGRIEATDDYHSRGR